MRLLSMHADVLSSCEARQRADAVPTSKGFPLVVVRQLRAFQELHIAFVCVPYAFSAQTASRDMLAEDLPYSAYETHTFKRPGSLS